MGTGREEGEKTKTPFVPHPLTILKLLSVENQLIFFFFILTLPVGTEQWNYVQALLSE